MNVTIEHPFCPYCSEVTNLYFRIINTLLFSKDENELRTSMESLKKEPGLTSISRRLWGTPSLDMQTKTERQKQNLSTPHHDDPILTWSLCTIRLELNIQFQPVTSFTAITFYIQNFIETQMAIGRTMIFAGLSIYILFWLRHIPL